MTGRYDWTVVIRGDWYLPHFVNMLSEYRGNGEQNECRDEVIAQIKAQMVDLPGDAVVKTTRPLVVIDPEDREQVERLVHSFWDGGNKPWATVDERTRGRLLDALQDGLRSLIEPPKPEEPTGLGAVVEAPHPGGADEYGMRRYVRCHATKEPWLGGGIKCSWADIPTPITVLSEGVE